MSKSLQIDKSKLFMDFFDKSDDRKIKYLVLHHIADKNLQKAIENLKKHEVSSHYIIGEDGKIFALVEEKDIAYHAGISFWDGEFNLNSSSIGIEFFSPDPYKIGFSEAQIASGIELCQEIIKKYQILPRNIVGHSDIAYDQETGFLNRKDDPSALFPWVELAKNAVGIYPKLDNTVQNDTVLFQLGNKNKEIIEIKKKLSKFGYKVDDFNENFNEAFALLTTVFNRRFNQNKALLNNDKWMKSSSRSLKVIF